MTINNMATLSNAYRYLYVNQSSAAKSVRNLSTGYKINSVADNAAGLAISEGMRGQIAGISRASQNAQSGVSLVQTAEGSLSSTAATLTRMQELAVQAANGTYSDEDRALLNREFNALKGSLDQTAQSANYNGIKLLDGSLGGKTGASGLAEVGVSGISAGGAGDLTGTAKFNITQGDGVFSITAQIGDQMVTNTINAGDTSTTFALDGGNTVTLDFASATSLREGVINNVAIGSGATGADVSKAVTGGANASLQFQIGANGSADQRIGLHINDMSSVGLGLGDADISTLEGANSALESISSAINQVSGQRGSLGATQNRLESTLNSLGVTHENLVASESSIRDLDYAREIMNFTQRNIQAQATQAMLAQGMNLSRQNLLSMMLR